MARPGEDAGRHAERDGTDRAHRLAGLADQPLHLRRGEASAPLVAVAGEEEEESVAAELENIAPLALADADQALEDAGDGEDELLGAGSSFRLQALGEARES